ncbi:exported protein family 1, putative [Plasmodium sp.]|nr:exported protein family 1, putative [Plasmodium sp.]
MRIQETILKKILIKFYITKLYDSGEYDETDKMIIIDPVIFFNLMFTSDMMYEYTANTQVATFVKLFFEKNIVIEDISYNRDEIMIEMMEGPIIQEEIDE